MKISELEESNRLKALEYQKSFPNGANDMDSISSFIWDKAPEGFNYWKTLHNYITNNNKPTHYQNKSNYDVIDFCNDNGLNFNRGASCKYVQRAGKKKYENLTIKESEIKDIEKAIDHLKRELIFLNRDFLQREIKFIKTK